MNQVQVRLGKTEIVVNKNGFGALPIQRISDELQFIYYGRLMKAVFVSLIRQEPIVTVNTSLGLRLKE